MKKETLSNIVFNNFKDPPWPAFVKPQPGELFSSWLLRLSRSHLLRYYSFCSSYFEGIEFWDRDLDKFLPLGIQNIVVRKTILKPDDIKQMLLSSFYPNLYVSDLSSRNPWFTPFSVYSNKYGAKHSTTLSVCPSCLKKDDEQPYFRKSWRLSIQTICENCECNLIDKCPNCSMPINHLTSEGGRKSQMSIFPITFCWKCLYDLKNHQITKSAEQFLNMQGFINTTIELGYDISHSLQYSHLYFSVLKKILCLLNKGNNQQLKKLQELICNSTNLDFIPSTNGRENPYELMSIEKRRNLLFKAYWLLGDWPNRFRETTSKAGLKSKLFSDGFHEIPYWFKSEIINNRILYAEWRKHYPDFSYGSFKEFAFWRISKMLQAKDPNLKRGHS